MIDSVMLAALLCFAPQLPPPPPPPRPPGTMPAAGRDAVPDRKGSSVIKGHVYAPDGRPLRRASIRLTGGGLKTPPSATTGLDGEYELRDLPAGRYTLTASRSGYLQLPYGARGPGETGQPIELADGVTLEKVDFTLSRAGTISGRITDETGEPAQGVDLWAMQEVFYRGRKQFVPMSSAMSHFATDDSGQYRLTGLAPGEYVVMATIRETWMSDDDEPEMLSYAPTFFPGTIDPREGRRVTVAAGQEAGAIDFSLVPMRAARLSGTVSTATGVPFASGSVMLSYEIMGPGGGRMGSSGVGRIQADGRWTLPDVPPGEYVLRATGAPAEGPSETASLRVQVSGADLDGLSLRADPGARIDGRLVTDTGAPLPPGRPTVITQLVSMETTAVRGTPGKDDGVVGPDGAFSRRTPSGDIVIRATGLPVGWRVKHVLAGDRDYEGAPFTIEPGQELGGISIVISNTFPDLEGAVVEADGRPTDATVLLFPTDPARWLPAAENQRVVRTDAKGRYRFEMVRPGSYHVVALDTMQDWQKYDADFLAPLRERAATLTVEAGAPAALDLKVSR